MTTRHFSGNLMHIPVHRRVVTAVVPNEKYVKKKKKWYDENRTGVVIEHGTSGERWEIANDGRIRQTRRSRTLGVDDGRR